MMFGIYDFVPLVHSQYVCDTGLNSHNTDALITWKRRNDYVIIAFHIYWGYIEQIYVLWDG